MSQNVAVIMNLIKQFISKCLVKGCNENEESSDGISFYVEGSGSRPKFAREASVSMI